MKRSNYVVVLIDDEKVVLQDLGPWNAFRTITNDAENVTEDMASRFDMRKRKIFYYDSEGEPTQLKHDGFGEFQGFGPATHGDLKKGRPRMWSRQMTGSAVLQGKIEGIRETAAYLLQDKNWEKGQCQCVEGWTCPMCYLKDEILNLESKTEYE